MGTRKALQASAPSSINLIDEAVRLADSSNTELQKAKAQLLDLRKRLEAASADLQSIDSDFGGAFLSLAFLVVGGTGTILLGDGGSTINDLPLIVRAPFALVQILLIISFVLGMIFSPIWLILIPIGLMRRHEKKREIQRLEQSIRSLINMHTGLTERIRQAPAAATPAPDSSTTIVESTFLGMWIAPVLTGLVATVVGGLLVHYFLQR